MNLNGWRLILAAAAALTANSCVSPGAPSGERYPAQPAYGPSGARPPCNAAAQVDRFNRLMTVRKPPLTPRDRVAGFVSTPLKHLSTLVDGPGAWEDTGCNASGSGRPVRDAQHSTDGFYTIDLAVADLAVEGRHVAEHRFLRLEVMPGTAAHRSLRQRRPGPADQISFSGPLVWDRDVDRCHPTGHMEVHPIAAIEFLSSPS